MGEKKCAAKSSTNYSKINPDPVNSDNEAIQKEIVKSPAKPIIESVMQIQKLPLNNIDGNEEKIEKLRQILSMVMSQVMLSNDLHNLAERAQFLDSLKSECICINKELHQLISHILIGKLEFNDRTSINEKMVGNSKRPNKLLDWHR